ncbi:YHYH protein [Candidatus Micrarchaeota archaeon]|nr:YHYH protein [Candidatus Micrarchaeota archaeon]
MNSNYILLGLAFALCFVLLSGCTNTAKSDTLSTGTISKDKNSTSYNPNSVPGSSESNSSDQKSDTTPSTTPESEEALKDTPGAVINTPSNKRLDLLPLGDGKYSTSPKVGYIYSCDTQFNGGGAFKDGPWIEGSVWDPSKKVTVDGAVVWKNGKLTITLSGDKRRIVSNDLPNHTTGVFPISSNDDAYQYDRNPNSIKEQSIDISLAANPTLVDNPSCGSGTVGIMLSGVPLFNGFDAGGRDAVAHEIQDSCGGHPQVSGQYHYHSESSCLNDSGGKATHSDLLGYSLDGFGIYGEYGENGTLLHAADLDECHGQTHAIMWDGKTQVMYHYHFTEDFPYSIGCFRAKPVSLGAGGGESPGGQMPPPR